MHEPVSNARYTWKELTSIVFALVPSCVCKCTEKSNSDIRGCYTHITKHKESVQMCTKVTQAQHTWIVTTSTAVN